MPCSFEEFRPPLERTDMMSDSGGPVRHAQSQRSLMTAAAAGGAGGRPLLLANSQGDLSMSSMSSVRTATSGGGAAAAAVPPELPLRRGGSVDRVASASAATADPQADAQTFSSWHSLARSTSVSNTNSLPRNGTSNVLPAPPPPPPPAPSHHHHQQTNSSTLKVYRSGNLYEEVKLNADTTVEVSHWI